ncbi:MAG: phosphoenolpyruvate--protein phosphotransferase [Candidatus Glassbacteria bacterium]|nr:phosphoenolpyruvate--protein phosphotransferase [Candidatus Glassbacteria bacterium]
MPRPASGKKAKGSGRKRKGQLILTGLVASPGLVMGKVAVIGHGVMNIPLRKLSAGQIADEIQRFQDALNLTRQQCGELRDRLRSKLEDKTASIFDAHLMMVDDVTVVEQTTTLIREQKICAEQAYAMTVDRFAKVLADLGSDSYLSARADDIRDVERRVLSNLMGLGDISTIKLTEPTVLVAHDLTPSQTAQLDPKMVLGCATDVGGTTSHTAILSRSLEIPAVVGLGDISSQVTTGDQVIVDGYSGRVIIRPTRRQSEIFYQRATEYRKIENRLAELKDLPARTVDGTLVELSANIEFPSEIDSVISHGAKGVGLFRTEFLYLTRPDLPSEQEQYEAYSLVARRLSPDSVIIRTLDLGADKFSTQIQSSPDPNPFLGNRAIRICLQRKDIFRTQLRAILRATPHGDVRILLPLVSAIEELKKSMAFIRKVRRELEDEGEKIARRVEIGSMIEVPSAALMIDDFLHFVDFVSIGTNDLIQYVMAADRGNERVAHLYQPLNPAVIRLIDKVIKAAKRSNKWVGVCGEMAGNPDSALLLVGLGVDELSTSPAAIPVIKKVIRSISCEQARDIADRVLSMNSVGRIKNYLSQRIEELGEGVTERFGD